MVKKLGIIVQAHIGSTRLPAKVMKDLYGHPVLWHVVERLRKVKKVDELIIATSVLTEDDEIEDFCIKNGVKCFRGSNDDVLSRFYGAAKQYELTDICRICSDNTLLDWEIISEEIETYLTGKYDIVTSGTNVPLGFGGEIFSYKKLEEAFKNATETYHHEHVTPYIYENSKNIGKFNIKQDCSKYRFTLDTEEDWCLISNIYGVLYKNLHSFTLKDILKVMDDNSDWVQINANVHQKKLGE